MVRAHPKRTTRLESLEPRRLLATDVAIRLETTDLLGNPIASVAEGDDFLLSAFVEDLRAVPEGVFAAYMDVLFDAPLVSPNGPITFGTDYPNGPSGDTSTPGLIDEVGAYDGFTSLGGGEFLLFSVPFKADAAGTVNFASDPADHLPMHDVLLFGADAAVPISNIDYGAANLVIAGTTSPHAAIRLSDADIDENDAATLTGDILDPGSLPFDIEIDWDDGSSNSTVTVPSGATSFSETHTYLDDNPTGTPSDVRTIALTITDTNNLVSTASTPITVNNVNPVITSIFSDATHATPKGEGEPVNVVANFTDVGTLDTHTAEVDWGDGMVEPRQVLQGPGIGTVIGNHAYASGGIYTVTVTITDDDGGSVQDTTTAVVTGVGLNNGTLFIIGTSERDFVSVEQRMLGKVDVLASFTPEYHTRARSRTFDLAHVDRILAYVYEEKDVVRIGPRIRVPAVIHGGDDGDGVSVGGGPSVLEGGAGRDTLIGFNARNILIGGLGQDGLIGGRDDDAMFGGTTTSDDDDNTLFSALDAWHSPAATQAARVAAIDAILTPVDDSEPDVLTGNSSRDIFRTDAVDQVVFSRNTRNPAPWQMRRASWR